MNILFKRRLHRICTVVSLAIGICLAQGPRSAEMPTGNTPGSPQVGQHLQTEGTPSTYLLGPDDVITLFASDVEEISNKPMRIDMRGELNLPMVGRIHAADLTADQLEGAIEASLKKYVKNPDVVVSITEFRSQPISVLGAVNSPGVHQLQGHKTLYEVLSLAGGLRPDAGNTVKITRKLIWGRIPLPDATNDASGQYSTASVSVKGIMDASNPSENIPVKPEDVISVPKADLVYVVGSVKKPGGYVLGQNASISTLQVLSLAEGLDHTAAPQNAKILRTIPGKSTRSEIPVNIRTLMAGKGTDPPLQADDILFIPNSASKAVGIRALETAVQVTAALAVYRF